MENTEELRSQLEYIDKLRAITDDHLNDTGRKISCSVVTFGCQMNTEHGKQKAAKTAAFSYGVVFGDERERKRGRISPSGRTGSEVRS